MKLDFLQSSRRRSNCPFSAADVTIIASNDILQWSASNCNQLHAAALETFVKIFIYCKIKCCTRQVKIALPYFRPLKSSNFAQLVARSGSQQGPICSVIILELPSFSLLRNVIAFSSLPLDVFVLATSKCKSFSDK